MQTRERSERDRSARKSLVVAVAAKDGVDAGETAGGTAHAVVGRDETLSQFVPFKFSTNTYSQLVAARRGLPSPRTTEPTHKGARRERRSG